MAKNPFINSIEYHHAMTVLDKRESLYQAFEEWDDLPRLADGYRLPWPAYTRHNWYELYTHFLYYPFRSFKEFAIAYGLNYNSSQTWINQRIFPGRFGINGDWKGNKNRWLSDVVRDNDIETIKMLQNPDAFVGRYKPLSADKFIATFCETD